MSFTDEEGMPSVVELAKILPPQSYMGEITEEEFDNVISNSVMETKYREPIERESAFEKLSKVKEERENEKKRLEEEKEAEKARIAQEKEEEKARKELERQRREEEKAKREAERARKNSVGYKVAKKAGNKVLNKALNKGVDALFGGSSSSKKKASDSVAKTILKSLFK